MGRRCNAVLAICTLIIIYLTSSSTSFSAAWTQAQGTGQAIFKLESYKTFSAYDGHLAPTTSDIKFSKYAFNPFVEYGIRNDITIGANPIVQYWQSQNSSSKINGQTFESELFVRKKLFEFGNAVFSVQPLIKTPCIPISGSVGLLACDSYDMEIRLLAGYGFKLEKKISDGKIHPFAGQYHFVDFETAYRKHTDSSSDVIKIDGTAGFRFNDNILLLGQLFSTIATTSEPVKIQNSVDRYTDIKLQLSGVVQTSKTTSIQLGVYGGIGSQLTENNYKTYQGVMVSLWKSF